VRFLRSFPRAALGGVGLALCVAAAVPASHPASTGQSGDELDAWLDRLAKDGRTVRLESVEGLTCVECHAAVAEEWRHSTHATSWQDEHYQKELRKVRRKQRCWGCHVPTPVIPAGLPEKPEAREDDRHLGIDCRTCHLDADGETVLGPAGHETDAHATRASEHFSTASDSALCVTCHAITIGPVIGVADDFVESGQAEQERSCIGCHMPALRGPWAEDPEGRTEYPERERRSHRLMTPRDPEFLASAFGLTARREGRQVVLSIENQAAHRVPGLTRRKLIFVVRAVDENGDTLAEKEHVLDHRSYLPVDETLNLVLEADAAKIEVEGRHVLEGMRRPQVFLQLTLEL